ncbi:hypothetical protein BGZ83_007381 [Gryganskiella cystojenkinii]|nr:hypothetical protein BGZ83_007381 [Gryganskiella cystojenkinii]
MWQSFVRAVAAPPDFEGQIEGLKRRLRECELKFTVQKEKEILEEKLSLEIVKNKNATLQNNLLSEENKRLRILLQEESRSKTDFEKIETETDEVISLVPEPFPSELTTIDKGTSLTGHLENSRFATDNATFEPPTPDLYLSNTTLAEYNADTTDQKESTAEDPIIRLAAEIAKNKALALQIEHLYSMMADDVRQGGITKCDYVLFVNTPQFETNKTKTNMESNNPYILSF